MKRIEAFNFVRDIPYRLPLSAEEADHGCEAKIKNRWVPLDATNGLRNEKSIPSK